MGQWFKITLREVQVTELEVWDDTHDVDMAIDFALRYKAGFVDGPAKVKLLGKRERLEVIVDK